MKTNPVPLRREHIPEVVEAHLESFPGFFLSFLGPRFLFLLYSGIVDSPRGGGFVRLEDGKVQGFVCGVADPSGFYRHLLSRRLFAFGSAAAGAVLRRPSIVPRLFRALTYPGRTPRGEDVAMLMSIGVRPGTQGKGIGQALIRSFLDWAARRGAKTVKLTTDAVNNDAVNALYRRMEFTLAGTFFTPEGREMNEYAIEIEGK